MGATRIPEPPMPDGRVIWHFTMSLDGFVAGPGHDMAWLARGEGRPGYEEEYITTTGAVIGGRDGFDAFPPDATYGGAWQGPQFILTHHPDDAPETPGVTFVSGDLAEVVRRARVAAGGKNVEVLSMQVGRQLLELGLIDTIDLTIAPVLLGDGIRVFDRPGGTPFPLELVNGDGPGADVELRYRPAPPA